ncbi:type IIL restriction-modification enzyme MmeI [Corynebacterium cystitidis]|uniref:type IIL restriction-modification enzyme MmeI n=1 Tax=Corynebacterium cystitidis TaxID=35757 RepID=UPI00211E0C05|nr:type IIL restriction-modification enzyme MmeI [Corynebacterium cystitidis]
MFEHHLNDNACQKYSEEHDHSRSEHFRRIIYNNFVFPEVDGEGRLVVEKHAQAVLDARAKFSEATLADLYDPETDWLYPELTAPHEALDATVERAYGVDFSGLADAERENAIVNHLFELYAQAVEEEG